MKAAITNPWTFITLCLALPVTVYSAMKWYDVFYSKPPLYQTANLNHLAEFVNQHNEKAGNVASGKATVVNLFFTSCPVVCVNMMKGMNKIHNRVNKNTVQLISLSVDPDRDNAARLQWYIQKMHIKDEGWHLLTGTKHAIYSFARNDLKLVAAAANGEGDFIHSDQLVLIDAAGHVRGYYNSADDSEINRIINDIKKLQP